MNISQSIALMGNNLGFAPGSIGDKSVRDILKNIDLTNYVPKKIPLNLKIHKVKMLFNSAPLLIDSIKTGKNPKKFLEKYNTLLDSQLIKIRNIASETCSFVELTKKYTEHLKFFMADFAFPMVIAPQLALKRINDLFNEDKNYFRDEIASLSMSLPGNKTAEMGEEMYKLASFDVIKANEVNEFIVKLNQNTLTPEFLKHWRNFIDKFGFRCFREIDVATPRPNEQPGLLFKQLKNLSLAINQEMGTRTIFGESRLKREAAYQKLYHIAVKKGKRHAQAFQHNYSVLNSLGGYRENPKHYITMVIDLFRKEVLQKAHHFVNTGRLDNPEQIFDLTIANIDEATKNPALDLRALTQKNTNLINKIKKSKLSPQLIDSRGKMFFPPRKEITSGELIGEPISPGIIQGKVKVLLRADEKPILPGEILVTRSTDPGWTPLFINAKGIILEIGGVLQHGAVVAREYGIPCVSGINNVLEQFEDGQMVEVDGSNGIVRFILSKENKESTLSAKGD